MAEISDREFEDQVRTVARNLWPEAEYDGAQKIKNRERDGVFWTEDVIHVVECTTSRKKNKAEYDIKKIVDLVKDMRKAHPNMTVKGWFVTMHEPEADQRAVAAKHKGAVQICSYEQFRSKLVDAADYLNCRLQYPFGSIVDLSDDSYRLPMSEYVELDIIEDGTGKSWDIKDICQKLSSDRGRFIILGDYGAGKSMTLREIFSELRRLYYSRSTWKFPIFINLRDHYGQTEPVEALERHARRIGFRHPVQIVRAWRAGHVDVLLDGFDEMATGGWVRATQQLRQIRYSAMTLLREFVRLTPKTAGLVVSGRSHYFDSAIEMQRAVGIGSEFKKLSLNEFREDQVEKFLSKKGLNSSIPDWLPTRPLLLGYLVAKRIIQDGLITDSPLSPASGWDRLLEMICRREARIEANIDGDAVREVIERLSTIARGRANGLGPLSIEDVNESYRQVVGISPDDKSQVLLLRLPGLGPMVPEDGSRTFIDQDLADAATAGDLFKFMVDPFNFPVVLFQSAQKSVGELGVGICRLMCGQAGIGPGKAQAALTRAASVDDCGNLAIDLFRVSQDMKSDKKLDDIFIRDGFVESLDFDAEHGDSSNVMFDGCYIAEISIAPDVIPEKMPRFTQCYFSLVDGRVGEKDLPKGVFDDRCEFEGFMHYAETTSDLLDTDLPENTKVLLTILRKLFLQPGRGRQESAFYRGLDQRSRRLVPDILAAVQSEGIAKPTKLGENVVWIPSRGETKRVRLLLAAPSNSSDPLLAKC